MYRIFRVSSVLLASVFAASVHAESDIQRMLVAANDQVGVTVIYDPAYVRLEYPGGDVPIERGVCSDVIIRAMRAVDIDLQVDIHRDLRAHFSAYPDHWGMKRPDSNIDHRRVPILETYLSRSGKRLPISSEGAAYLAGDFVSWRLDGGQPHIGIVSEQRSPDHQRPFIIHNIGAGTQVEDVLFEWKINGHFRYFAEPALAPQTPAPPTA